MKLPFSFSQKEHADSTENREPSAADPIECVLAYHEETKHHMHRYARSLGYLDWNTQPNPFRVFDGAPPVQLPLVPYADSPSWDAAVSRGSVAPAPVSLESISRFFRNALGITAWKRYGISRWALRANPSSGNLHPTEGYLVTAGCPPALSAGVYHYRPREHTLERRCSASPEAVTALLPRHSPDAFLAGLTSIHWREAWKYGERAYRYCQHDTGHALAAFAVSAAILGWEVRLLEEASDEDVSALLGLDRQADFAEAEREDPDLLVMVFPTAEPTTGSIRPDAIREIAGAAWHGHANRLSVEQVDWEIITRVAQCSIKPRTASSQSRPVETAAVTSLSGFTEASAEKLVLKRRSAVALDGVTGITSQAFYRILSSTLPTANSLFRAFEGTALARPFLHLGVFVHRVHGLDPGIYFLARDPSRLPILQQSMLQSFEWAQPDGCPSGLRFYRLVREDVSRLAAGLSCGQDIAGDGAFSLGMIAEFEPAIRASGSWLYRRLFWEAGFVGQILYLEAEAAGVRGTGIGCYFDDPVHERFGIKGRAFQSLYHFTIGQPVEDLRITTEPAYPADSNNRSAG